MNKIIKNGVKVMAKALRFLIVWPEKEATIRNMPKVFKRSISYQKTRVIIDCSEIFIKRPTNLLARNITYSNYKHHNTMKFLVGITPCGAVSFLSKCWGGRVSDKKVTLNSGFLDQLEYGDQVISSCSILTTLLSTVFAFVLTTSMETKLCKIFVETGYETYMGTLAFYVK